MNIWLHGIASSWHLHEASEPIITPSGEKKTGFVMRRRHNGQWQFRECTPDELRCALLIHDEFSRVADHIL